jgi:DNA-binding transcriptional LysR family regulator
MKLRQLQCFLSVAEERGFSRAADALHMAQPSLSVQIKALEHEVGARLFDRDKRHVSLTQPGRRFLQHARAILAMVDTAKLEARCAAVGELGILDIGYTSSAMFSSVLPHAIRDFRESHPHVLVTLHELTSLEQVHGLLDRTLDVAILRKPDISTPMGIEISEWYRTPLIVALPEDHRLARLKSIGLAALAEESFIMLPREAGTGLYWQIMSLCSKAGFRPRVVREVLEPSSAIGLVAAGIGIAVVPETLNRIRFEGVVYKGVSDAQAHSTLYIARREADRTEHLRLFCEMLVRKPAPERKRHSKRTAS